MEKLQTGIDSLVRSSVSGAWKMTFTPPEAEPITVILDKNFVEVGPRLREVLTSIERNGDNQYPRTIQGQELEGLGMTTRESFLVRMLQGQPAHIEIAFRPYRRFLNPAAPKVKGALLEDPYVAPQDVATQDFRAQVVEEGPGGGSGTIDKVPLGEQIKAKEEALMENTNPMDGMVLEWKYEESGDNRNEYIEPLDDRVEELFGEDKIDLDHRVRIGDVMMTIPPLSIDINRVSSIEKIKTLRTKSSMLIKGGSSATTMTMQLYFHDLESINGKKVRVHPEHDRYYFMDGLRPLIAQFKKAPFVPIDNVYINETLGIDSVALVNLSIQTVPGFPNSIAATLVLMQFDHTAYMPQVAHLGDALNYPMFRWYYQEPLRDDLDRNTRSEYRTWLDPIPESGLTNDFVFLEAEEAHLQQRKQAVQDIRNMVNPSIAKERFFNPGVESGVRDMESGAIGHFTQLGKEYKDGFTAQIIKAQYKRYLELKNAGRLTRERNSPGYGGVPSSEEISTEYTGDKWAWAFHYIYGDKETDESVMKKPHFAPFESHIVGVQSSYYVSESSNGAIKIDLYSDRNVDLFKEQYETFNLDEDNGLKTLLVAGTNMWHLDTIIDRGHQAETAYLKSLEEWDAAKTLLEQTEAKIPLRPVSIEGTLIPVSMNVIYENQFSSIQMQSLESPSFQFMGGQDPYIQVTFDADELAVSELRSMLERTERFSRDYRVGISSGFLGIENHLTRLFGVESVMPENVSIRTVPGYPDRFHVEMTLCGFNKTQKRTEELEGISPIYGDGAPSKESRKTGNYDESRDNAIIEMQMSKMELYPDLELPTYGELISALPYMGADCEIFESRSGARYVDPDFYMATPETLREIMREKQKNPNGMEMKMDDFMGVQLSTKSGMGRAIDGDDENLQLFESMKGRTQTVSSTFSWSGNVDLASGGTSNDEGITFADKHVEAFLKDEDKVKEPPSLAVWKSWGLGNDPRNYEAWKSKKVQPEPWEVYNKIYQMVDELWVAEGYAYNDKSIDPRTESWQTITYASQADLVAAEAEYISGNRADTQKGTGDRLRGRGGNTSATAKSVEAITKKEYKATESKPPRERIANIIKAVLDHQSQWRQMKSNLKPRLDADYNAAGIMGIPLSSEAITEIAAKRLLWDWKYNIEWGIKFLFTAYKAALEKDDLDYQSAPWEWMVSAFGAGTIETDMDNEFWMNVSGVFNSQYNKYTRMYATPVSQMDEQLLQQRNGYTSREMNVFKRVKADLIDEMVTGGYIDHKGERTGQELRDWFKAMSSAEVTEKYELWASFQDNDKEGSGGYTGTGLVSGFGIVEDFRDYKMDDETQISEYMDEMEQETLVNTKNPDEIFPEMMNDLVEYDMRMRLARAFPTFQMFIVDEGRWMSNYRLWDNLYGFNAIQSIDVYKSRKISADTAVIKMTNIYSNLTARTMDSNYGEHDYKFWDNLVWGKPNESLLEARQELQNSLLLQTGARIHLRLGYGSIANELPVVFNGTITEMNAEEMVELVCQGDGVELGNIISGDPDDTNKGFFTGVTEPRDLLCELLTSKGNWFKDVINNVSEGALFKDNPLGIQHFGQPPGEAVQGGNLSPFNIFKNDHYGEAARNIYSSNGLATFNQWTMNDGEDIPLDWASTPISKWGQPGDEQNIVVPFYNNTTWDIAQTLAACSPDYIATVHPFEMRSTLFFGKPYWGLAHRYDSRYEYSEAGQGWIRYRDVEHRKPYSQFHFYDSHVDIISNRIKASEEGVYTVVIANYDGGQTQPMYADKDIRFDKQKTAVVDAEIVGDWPLIDFWTAEKQATNFAASTLRDYIKDMYKGSLLVLGDPSVKPYDMCYMNDTMFDMNGSFNVKAVTHHFSQETGFVTSIEPDVIAVTDDVAAVALADWTSIVGANASASIMGYVIASRAAKRAVPSAIRTKLISMGAKGGTKALEMSLANLLKGLPDDDPDIRKYKKTLKNLGKLDLNDPDRANILKELQQDADKVQAKVQEWDKNGNYTTADGKKVRGTKSALSHKMNAATIRMGTEALMGDLKDAKGGRKAFQLIRGAGSVLLSATGIGLVVSLGSIWLTETMFEKYRRRKAAMQAVLIMPLQYQGRAYTAGINGHRGMVVGDPMGKEDSFFSGMGWNGKNGDNNWEWTVDVWNWFANADKKEFSTSREDLMNTGEDD